MKNTLLLGTRKGLIQFEKNGNSWQFSKHSHLGIGVSIAAKDARNGTLWACLDHGHWGQKLERSVDGGENWEEVEAPKYPEGSMLNEEKEATTSLLWSFAEGGNDRPDVLHIGTEPGGLFTSRDGGNSWQLNEALWNVKERMKGWFGGGRDNAAIHSVIVDPRDSDHYYIGISCAGVYETTDDGKSWTVRNKGMKADFRPDPDSEVGQDPHIVVQSPSNPDVMWNQNHCGIYRSANGGHLWENITQKDGPASFGFCMACDENDDKIAWVVPGLSDEKRVAIDGALVVCCTEDAGQSWTELRNGLPQKNCYDIVYRHALDITGDMLCFGTTTGNVFISENRGENWQLVSGGLPMVHSVRFV